MNANTFKQRFDDLMECALNAEDGAPIGMMIFSLEVAKAKCVALQLQAEAGERQKILASKIIPANGKLPPPTILPR